MASLNASSAAFAVAGSGLVQKRSIGASSPIIGLPSMANKGRVRCSAEKKAAGQESGVTTGASLLAAAAAATVSSPAMALVDERMSTEGVGLPFGLSNNLLGWILFGVFGLIWALYFSYTSSLEEDEESGLSL
uniref:PSII 6.1 kDa protein n=1 Tax=Kalanchoe fedtschenkoi TaxID=63787 RepID=A0A7N0UDP2_KALFE